MVLTVAVVGVVQPAVHQITDVIAVGNGLMPAIRSMRVSAVVGAAIGDGGVLRRILCGYGDLVFLHLAVGAWVVKVAVMEEVHMSIVTDPGVTTVRSVSVGMGPCMRVCHDASLPEICKCMCKDSLRHWYAHVPRVGSRFTRQRGRTGPYDGPRIDASRWEMSH
jgi:hypothetical protein